MKMDSRREIGNAGLAMAIGYFGANGMTVSIPLNDTQNYDLVVDYKGSLKKVQVKATNSISNSGAYVVQLKTVSGTTRKVYKTVKDTDVDMLFCLCGDGTMYLIPVNEIKNVGAINLGKGKSKYTNKSLPDWSKYIVHL
mgnify:CR=1 FL=1|jgi:hypothetical protein